MVEILAHSSASHNPAQQVLSEVFGYQEFRPGQIDIINAILSGESSIVIMPTGGGKSLCYQVPALLLPGLTLVISPLISLMKDQVDQLNASGVSAACLHSALEQEQIYQIYQQLFKSQLRLLYVSPERAMTTDFIQRLQRLSLSLIAIDEAHCISQWGHDFRPEYAGLGQLHQLFPSVPIIALTATADDATRHDILQRLQLNNPYFHMGGFDRPNIRYTVLEKYQPLKQLEQLIKQQKGQCGIIYCNSRKKVESISESLNNRGYKTAAYHAGLESELRFFIQEDFQKDNIQVVVATVAFGMGINKSNVRFVVHYDIPRTIESYYQETGRAGRDGLNSEAFLFFDPADMAWLRSHLENKEEGPQKIIETQKLNAMAAFADAQTCRRQVLLNYFGDSKLDACGNCDICLNPTEQYDGLIDAQKVLSSVYRTGQSYGIQYIVDILIGRDLQRIRENGHQQLSIYGIGKEHDSIHWISVTRQLIHLGFLQQNITNYSTLQLTEAARSILRAEVPLQLAKPRRPQLSSTTHHKQTYDDELFQKLRTLRKSLADKRNIPPYVIFSDASLIDMVKVLPKSPAEMLAVNGVGYKKLEQYGRQFLDEIEAYFNHNSH